MWQVPEAKFIQEICVLIYLTYTKFQASKIIFVMSGTFQRAAKFIDADCISGETLKLLKLSKNMIIFIYQTVKVIATLKV